MDIMSADYADTHFPCKLWDMGQNGITLSQFEWDKATQIMLYGQNDFSFGDILTTPIFETGDPIRLYHRKEIEQIMQSNNMQVQKIFSDFSDSAGTENSIQMLVFSVKTYR